MFRRVLLIFAAVAVTAAIAVAAMRQTQDLPPVGGDIWIAVAPGFALIVVLIVLFLWLQRRRR